MRAGKINIVTVLLVAVVGFAGVFAYTFGPYYLDYMSMDEVARNTALTYSEWGKTKGEQRLTQELYNRDIPDYIVEKDCKFSKKGEEFTVTCIWDVEKNWPFTSKVRAMHFEVSATYGPMGFIK